MKILILYTLLMYSIAARSECDEEFEECDGQEVFQNGSDEEFDYLNDIENDCIYYLITILFKETVLEHPEESNQLHSPSPVSLLLSQMNFAQYGYRMWSSIAL